MTNKRSVITQVILRISEKSYRKKIIIKNNEAQSPFK